MSGNNTPQVIDLSKLDLEQLTGLKKQLDNELQFFSESLQQLKVAQVKFTDSGEAVEKFSSTPSGKEILVPLTSCMYVPGKIADSDKLMIDIGTGYYVEKNSGDAKEYFNRRVKYLTTQLERIQKIASEKNKLREVVMDMMEMKVNQQLAVLQQQEQLASKS